MLLVTNSAFRGRTIPSDYHRQRLRRLYEQDWRYGKEKARARVVEYVRRWKIWRKYMIQLNMPSTGTMSRTLAILLLVGLVGAPLAASAATVPSCGSESWAVPNISGNPIRLQPYGPPGVSAPAGTPVGILQNSGTNVQKTCRMPAGTTRFYFGFGMLGGQFSLNSGYMRRVGTGTYENNYPVQTFPGSQLRVRLGGGHDHMPWGRRS